MSIFKNVLTPTGVNVSYHEFYKLFLNSSNNYTVYIKSYVSKDKALEGVPIAWMWELSINKDYLKGISAKDVEVALVEDQLSPFYGGELLLSLETYGDLLIPPRPSEHHIFDWSKKEWIDPRTAETEWPLVRAKRNQLLAQSDWTQLPDVPIAAKEAWAVYRQALRDVTLQPDPFNITWPVPPQEN